MRRLEGIDQSGLPLAFHPKNRYSRFEHSVGVYVLLAKMGASVEEQLAGLLHDVSHTACSHLIDWVQGDPQIENFQDKRHPSIVRKGMLGQTLLSHGYDPARIADYSHFSLLEQPSPIVCADRLDYGMRELADWAAPELAPSLTSAIENHKGRIVFRTERAAHQFGYNFARLQREYWGYAEYMGRYRLLAEALQEGLAQHIITLDDFDGVDETLLAKVEREGKAFPAIRERLKLLTQPQIFFYTRENESGPAFRYLKVKFRSVDPSYLDERGQVQQLSTTWPTYAEMLVRDKERTERGIWIRFTRSLPELHKP